MPAVASAPASQTPPAPPVLFHRSLTKTRFGIRVQWVSRRDAVHHPESFEVVASGEGVKLCGYSPTMQTRDLQLLAEILAEASVVVEMIREGFDLSHIKKCLESYQKD